MAGPRRQNGTKLKSHASVALALPITGSPRNGTGSPVAPPFAGLLFLVSWPRKLSAKYRLGDRSLRLPPLVGKLRSNLHLAGAFS
jgi:hypothetical protein